MLTYPLVIATKLVVIIYQIDGTKCVATLDCTTITPTGNTESDKASFCNKLGDGKKCTFMGGGTKCVNTIADCTYTLNTLPLA